MRVSSDGADRNVLLQTEAQLGRGAHNVRFSLLLFVHEHSSVLPSSGVSALSTTEYQHSGATGRRQPVVYGSLRVTVRENI
jgi:hypothetical protein